MKWMIASDIHGSAYYCERLIEAFASEKADRLLLLGDLLYHGPRNDPPRAYDPKRVIELLNPLRESILCVRGNCDSEVDQMVLAFPILADYAVIALGSRVVFATHGHHFNPDVLPPLKDGDILLFGHTHVPFCEQRGGILCCNPGSAAMPKEDSVCGYMTSEEKGLLWKTIDGEILRSLEL